MKKNILLFAFILISAMASAQFTVWEDDFNDGEAADWKLLDEDGNGSNWLTRKNIQLDPNTGQVVDGTVDILGTYNVDLATLSFLETTENNWAIAPVQDLSFYTGTVQLVINAQISVYGGSTQDISVYVSNTPDVASFLENEPVVITLSRMNDEGEEFQDYVVDIAQYAGAGQPEVYFAIQRGGPQFLGVEIDNVKITATEVVAGINDAEIKTATIISQNPVVDNLKLQLGNKVNTESLNLYIYNVSGMLVKEVKYSEDGVEVGDLASGLYFVELNDGSATEQLKFIKK